MNTNVFTAYLIVLSFSNVGRLVETNYHKKLLKLCYVCWCIS